MKRSLFVLAILLLSFGLASAVDFHVEFGPQWTTGKVFGDVVIDVYMHNTPGEGARMGYSIPLMISGDCGPITWNDAGGIPSTGGALVINPNFAPGGPWLPSVNTINIFSAASWDGNLPDTFNHTTTCIPITACPGWTDNVGDQKVYSLHLTTADFPIAEPHQLCIDSIGHSNPTYDWLWAPLSGPFGGPYCITVEKAPNLPPEATDCPTVDIELQWSGQVSRTINWTDAEGDPLAAATADVGSVTIAGMATNWTYNPDCGDVGSHTVTICATDAVHACPTGNECVFTVSVLNTPPVIAGDCGDVIPVSIVGTATASFTATDANAGDVLAFSLADDIGGAASIVGGVVTFDGAVAGAEGLYDVTVIVTDCAGDTDECTVTFQVQAELPFKILITKEEDVYQGHHRMVDVIKTEGTNDMYGFDFLIAYDASALAFMGAVPGVLFDIPGNYEWEYFTYRFGPFGNCGNGCPSGMLRVVGMADQNDGPHHPESVEVPDGMVLFSLDFLVSNDRTYECQYVPVRFFWTDCGDNTIAYHSAVAIDPLEILLGVSRDVYWYGGVGSWINVTNRDVEYGFPTFYGTQSECLVGVPDKPAPNPFIDFYGGGIDIICADDIDARGDINLNGISNEIADAVVFVNYFVYGMTAFTINEEGQIAATDVNADGIVLSVADLVYLIRVIVGDALPYPKLTPYATTATFVDANGVISTEAELGAALFTFEGTANVSLASGVNMDLKVGNVNGITKALVYSIDGKSVTGNVIVSDGKLASIEAVDYYGSAYKVVLPTDFALGQNYPNPFNPDTKVDFTVPANSNWTLTIYNVAGQTVKTFSGTGSGPQSVTWNADAASGIYFYSLKAGDFSATKKMTLLK